jgi:transcription elongation factor Elf1
MPYPHQPEPRPIWICPGCEKLMRVRTIEIANDKELTRLVCGACGTEATQIKVLAD